MPLPLGASYFAEQPRAPLGRGTVPQSAGTACPTMCETESNPCSVVRQPIDQGHEPFDSAAVAEADQEVVERG